MDAALEAAFNTVMQYGLEHQLSTDDINELFAEFCKVKTLRAVKRLKRADTRLADSKKVLDATLQKTAKAFKAAK